MNLIRALIARVLSERGQTLSEYAILIVWICLLVVVAATTLGHTLSSAVNSQAARL